MKSPLGVKIHTFCPRFGGQHIDEGKYAVRPHKTHPCFHCGKKFKVAKPTIGVKKGIDETVILYIYEKISAVFQ